VCFWQRCKYKGFNIALLFRAKKKGLIFGAFVLIDFSPTKNRVNFRVKLWRLVSCLNSSLKNWRAKRQKKKPIELVWRKPDEFRGKF
jgi:hypothetical protein